MRLLFLAGTLLFKLLATLANMVDELLPRLVIVSGVAEFALFERFFLLLELAVEISLLLPVLAPSITIGCLILIIGALIGADLTTPAWLRLLISVIIALRIPPIFIRGESLLRDLKLVIGVAFSVLVLRTIIPLIIVVTQSIFEFCSSILVMILTPTEILLIVISLSIWPRFFFVPIRLTKITTPLLVWCLVLPFVIITILLTLISSIGIRLILLLVLVV
jgi:hypothetical protein